LDCLIPCRRSGFDRTGLCQRPYLPNLFCNSSMIKRLF
jgi:hypothetical protein